MSLATHPGAVATEQQKGATEAYGMLGKALESVASYTFMAPEQGAESALWAGTAPSVSERRVEVNGRYFTEADGKVSESLSRTTRQKCWNEGEAEADVNVIGRDRVFAGSE